MRDVLMVELLKVRRSRLLPVTVLAFLIAPGVGALFMFVLQDPDRARALGLLGEKAQLAGGPADWPAYLALLAQTVAVGGVIVFGIVHIWLFGREFADDTVKDLLALPVGRHRIVLAKLAVGALWCLSLGLQALAFGLVFGRILDLPGWTWSTLRAGAGTVLTSTALVIALAFTFALAASVLRGYLGAVGVLFATVFVAQVVAALGYGHVFPYAVPAVAAGIAPNGPHVAWPGYLLVVAVGAAAVATTTWWWRTADQA
jgi:ABC-2 type transport system permease protein